MELNLTVIDEQCKAAPEIEGGHFYNMILNISRQLFGRNSVELEEKTNRIFIKSAVSIQISYSWNENKVYIYNTLQAPGNIFDMPTNRRDRSFRFFNIKTVYNYLLLKKQENEFILNNEG